VRRTAFTAALVGATFLVLGFLVLPVIAIFTHVPVGDLLAQFSNPVVYDALRVSARTTLEAQALVLVFGTPAAYLLATKRFPGRALAVTAIELPLVLPPAVAGLGLLVAFGRYGLLSTSLAFTQAAVVLAVAFVSGPLYVRTAIAAFEAVDPSLVDAARTLGAGPARTFGRVALPLARSGLAAGFALALARGLGEFGATIMFAGSLQGTTQTLPVAIYLQFDASLDAVLAISALLVVVSGTILVSLKLLSAWTRSPQPSAFRFAPSPST
jgi:molybdate transport system permease protein